MNILDKLTKLENEANDFGFKWQTAGQIMSQIKGELREIEAHLLDGNKDKLQEEMGDLLHAVFSLCLFSQCDAEMTLINAVDKFARRFNIVKQLANNDGLATLNGKSFNELMFYWNNAKEINGAE